MAAGTLACLGVDAERPPAEELRPLVQALDSTGRIRVAYGAGRLRTISDSSWHEGESVTYPMVVDGGGGQVLVQVNGLDLADLGELRWPVDTSVAGATVQLTVGGPWAVEIIGYPVLVDPARVRPRLPQDGDTLYRGYVFEGRSTRGWFARRRFRAIWRGADRFDVRVRTDDRAAWVWVRQRITRTAGGTAGRSGPGIALGEWLLVGRRDWGPSGVTAPVRPVLEIRNWKNARGPYTAAWDDVLVTGNPDRGVLVALGRGELRAAATGSLAQQAVSGSAEFSFVAVEDLAGSASAVFRYRTRGLTVEAVDVGWFTLGTGGASFGGRATVNGSRGYRYEVKARDGAAAGQADWISVEILSGANAYTLPAYATAGSLLDDAIEIRSPDP